MQGLLRHEVLPEAGQLEHLYARAFNRICNQVRPPFDSYMEHIYICGCRIEGGSISCSSEFWCQLLRRIFSRAGASNCMLDKPCSTL